MPEISAIFAAFQKGEIRFEALDAALGEILADNPERVSEIQAALKAAKDDGLPWHVYAVLRGNMDLIAEKTLITRAQEGAESGEPTNDYPIEDETIVLAEPGGDLDTERTLITSSETSSESGRPTDASTAYDATVVVEQGNLDGTTAPIRGSLADNAKRLGRDREATEHMLMTYLGQDFGGGDSESSSSDSDIFSRPFTEDEIADTELTSAPDPTEFNDEDGEFGPGHMLRKRFQLLKKLGEGGMGAVWRARDMLKVRARDRNPYVAIKLLTGDFREHPEAFIALQRETSKQQRLAHPNIATVFNFDRDQSTNTVFMTMEVMEGESMDKFIRKLPVGGLDVEESMPIIEQLGAGLSYAHQNALVHSDLKPGNCFLTRKGVVKLLDFGIARASKTEAHAEGERTLFDPGKLGAITPAYATVEMFDGMEPDPRDDIYALAIMTYQLFTGKHPFGRQRADKAMSLGLEVPYVAKLNKRQNRGLAKGLAFKREDRTASVEEFLQDIRPRKKKTATYVGGGIAAALIIGALTWNPMLDLVRARENASIIAQIEGGEPAKLQMGIARITAIDSPGQQRRVLRDQRTIDAMTAAVESAEGENLDLVLALVAKLDPDWQQDFFGYPSVRQAVLKNFRTRIDAAFDPDSNKLDYAGAWAEFQKLDALLPNSASVLTIRNSLERRRNALVAELEEEYERLLELGAIVPVDGDRDISDVVADLSGLMPEHRLMSDARLNDRVTELARQFLEAGEFDAAERYIIAGLGYAPKDSELARLRGRRASLAEKAERDRLGAELRARLDAAKPNLETLKGFQSIKRDLVTLTVLDPNDAFALSLGKRHQELFQSAFDDRLESASLEDAAALLAANAPLLDSAYLTAARSRLSTARSAAPADSAAAEEDLYAGGLETLTHHVASSRSEIGWTTDAVIGIRAFTAVLPPGDPRLEQLRRDVIAFLLSQASEAASDERYDSGRNWIARARMVSPGSAEMQEAAEALETAANKNRMRREYQRDLVEFEVLQEDFAAALADGRAKDAEDDLDRMKEIADRNAEIGAQSVAIIGDAYAGLGEAYAGKADYESAARIASAAIDAGWASTELSDAHARYREALEQRALIFSLRSRLEVTKPLDVASIENDIKTLARQFPHEIDVIRSDLASRRVTAIIGELSAKNVDASKLTARMAEFSRLFPDSDASMRNAVTKAVFQRIQAEQQRDPLAARRLADQMTALLPDDSELKRLARALPPSSILEARKLIDSGRLTRAAVTLENDRKTIGGLPEYAALKRDIALKQAQAKRKYKTFVARVKTGSLRSREMRLAAYREVKALWFDNPEFDRVNYVDREPGTCLPDLAGEGRELGGSCFDPLPGGMRAPLMVVVPAASAGDRPFAIGKYEVSVAEYNRYCAATGACGPKAVRNDKLPVTGISLAEAKRYADWLSRQATAASRRPVVYRLPSRREWRHAAAAAGELPSRAINCRPKGGSALTAGLISSQGGTLSLGMPIGRSLVSATFGEANGWGLVNAVGNAQEWAIAGSGRVVARGGAFEDPLPSCGIDSERSHDGGADSVTGFRLVRELG